MATKLIDLIEDITQDDLPTNVFTIEDEDPMVILGKLNEVIAWLKELNIDDIESVLEMIGELREDINDLETNKQDNLTETQLDAVNSGITTELVEQITTNQEDIEDLNTNKQDNLSVSQLNNIDDIPNKLDKVNNSNKIYATDSNGDQTTLDYQSSQTDSANKIVQRDSNGDVLVPATPTSNNGATSKEYVDDNFVNTNGYGKLTDMNTLVRANKTYWYENTTTNQPEGRQDWGTVQYIAGFTTNWVTQLVFPNTQPFFYKRAYVNGVWEDWTKISTMTDLGRLYAGNSNGTYNIENISNFKYILLALKSTADEWITTLFPTSQIIDELNNNIPFQMVTQDNTPDDYKYAYALFNSSTNITIGLFNSYYCILWGVK